MMMAQAMELDDVTNFLMNTKPWFEVKRDRKITTC
jgi:hypothetical protein